MNTPPNTATHQSTQSGTDAPAEPRGNRRRPVGLIHDVERVAQGLIESSPGDLVELTDGFVIEIDEWHGDDVVAADDADLRKSVLRSELHL